MTSARAGVVPPRTEKAFMAAVVEIAKLYGWLVYHAHDSRRSEPGVPDLLLCKPPRVIFAELKRRGGRVSPAQRFWLEQLGQCTGVCVFLWCDTGDLRPIAGVLRAGEEDGCLSHHCK